MFYLSNILHNVFAPSQTCIEVFMQTIKGDGKIVLFQKSLILSLEVRGGRRGGGGLNNKHSTLPIIFNSIFRRDLVSGRDACINFFTL